jgi:hypothetical protein
MLFPGCCAFFFLVKKEKGGKGVKKDLQGENNCRALEADSTHWTIIIY